MNTISPDARRAMVALRVDVPEQIAFARVAEAERLRAGVDAAQDDEPRAATQRATRPRRFGRIPDELVAQIRAAREAGESYRTIAEKFDVSEGVVSRALRATVTV